MSNNNYYRFNDEYWRCNIDEIIAFCREKKYVYLYGAGVYGGFLKEQLSDAGIEIEAFIVTDKCGLSKAYEKNVFDISEFTYDKENMGIVVCTENYKKEITLELQKKGIGEYKILNVEFKKPVVNNLITKEDSPNCISNMKDGLIRLRITNKCPGRCDFCGQLAWPIEEQNREMPSKWYFEYMKPLYSQIKAMLITGGDSFFASHSYEFMKFMSVEYPQVTIITESNGLTFNEGFQRLASDNLFITHFSLNASNAKTYKAGCWSSEGGEKAYNTCVSNVKNYIKLLECEGKLCFAPNISMVINKNTADDVVDFLKFALLLKTSHVSYYFDYRENDMEEDFFQNPEIGRKALKQLMELERVLKDKFYIAFRLWTPMKELGLMQSEVDNESDEMLNEKYADILALAETRNIVRENEERNLIRRKTGKKELTVSEDTSYTLQTTGIGGVRVCKSAWKLLDIYPNGRVDFCSWHIPTLFLSDYIKDDKIDWDEIVNSDEFCTYRQNMLDGDYSGCMKCCPIIKNVHEDILL